MNVIVQQRRKMEPLKQLVRLAEQGESEDITNLTEGKNLEELKSELIQQP
jgi:hypothetical protein